MTEKPDFRSSTALIVGASLLMGTTGGIHLALKFDDESRLKKEAGIALCETARLAINHILAHADAYGIPRERVSDLAKKAEQFSRPASCAFPEDGRSADDFLSELLRNSSKTSSPRYNDWAGDPALKGDQAGLEAVSNIGFLAERWPSWLELPMDNALQLIRDQRTAMRAFGRRPQQR